MCQVQAVGADQAWLASHAQVGDPPSTRSPRACSIRGT
jgi:hypothetical protein